MIFSEAAALAEKGLSAQQARDPAAALLLYEAAATELDAVPEFHNNLALCYQATGAPTRAEHALRRALELRPAYAEAHNNLGNVLQGLKRYPEARDAYQSALQLNPAYGKAYFNLGTLWLETGDLAAAQTALEKAVSLQPDFADAWRNLGLVRGELGDSSGALAAHNEACRLAPDDPEAHCNRALAHLLRGDFSAGWTEYEWRWRLPDHPMQVENIPLWQGEDLKGKRLLLWTEQGAGTSIQFIRYVAPLAARGAQITVACEENLRRLFATLPFIRNVIPRTPDLKERREWDFHLPLVSAAHRLKTDLSNLPPPIPFPLPSSTPRSGPPRIAFVWASNPINDARRSLSLSAFAPLIAAAGDAVWISFQHGPERSQLSDWPGAKIPQDRGGSFADFYDTALALNEVDFVVTVDTSVAHLAGTVGKPTHLLLRFFPDWRWLTDRSDSPWYPSLRLFRQTAPGAWETAIDALASDLAAWRAAFPL